jgi:hypothetical protein
VKRWRICCDDDRKIDHFAMHSSGGLTGPPVEPTRCRCVTGFVTSAVAGALADFHFDLKRRYCCRFAADGGRQRSLIQFLIVGGGNRGAVSVGIFLCIAPPPETFDCSDWGDAR